MWCSSAIGLFSIIYKRIYYLFIFFQTSSLPDHCKFFSHTIPSIARRFDDDRAVKWFFEKRAIRLSKARRTKKKNGKKYDDYCLRIIYNAFIMYKTLWTNESPGEFNVLKCRRRISIAKISRDYTGRIEKRKILLRARLRDVTYYLYVVSVCFYVTK